MKNILFITSTRLGDAVISTGVLDYFLKTYPEARFTIACGPVAAGLFDAMPRRVKTLVIEKRRWDMHWLLLWKDCIFQSWDMVVDLRGSFLGYFLFAQQRKIIKGGRIRQRRIHHLATSLSLNFTPLPVVWIGGREQAWAETVLPQNLPKNKTVNTENAGKQEKKYIAFAPTANWVGKIWPVNRFIELAAKLIKEDPTLMIAVFYGPGEQEHEMAKPLLDANLPVMDCGGKYSLVEVAALLSRCQGFVGNDSGLMHLAAACQIPVLGLFGPSRASEYAPAGKHAEFIVAAGEEGKAPIDGLSAQDVFAAFKSLLDRTRSSTIGIKAIRADENFAKN